MPGRIMMRVAPSWFILRYLHLIPNPKHPVTDTYPLRDYIRRGSCSNPGFCFHICLAIITVTYLLAVFMHDIFNLLFNKNFWSHYMVNTNKIITLLILLNPIAIDWKNCLSVCLFAVKSNGLSAFIADLTNLDKRLKVTDKQQLQHQVTFAFCYFTPLLLNVLRIVLFALYLFDGSDPTNLIPYGFNQVPRYLAFIICGLTQFIGELLSFSVYVQIAAFADAMVQCCKRVNGQLVQLKDGLVIDRVDQMKYVTFRQRVMDVRRSYEDLVAVYVKYEGLFSLQIVGGVINNGLIIFATVASFFKMGDTNYWYVMHALSCGTYLFIIMMISIFPIHLHEESLKTSELLQDVIYKYQLTHFIDAADASTSSDSKDAWAQDSFVLYGFLQRTITKPLVVTGGGFVELTRSFTISVVALLIGFTLFLLEQFEGHRVPVTCLPFNTTAYNLLRNDTTPTLLY